MENEIIQELRNLNIETVAMSLGLDVLKHRTLCCFHHENTPSLSFNISKGTYRCWSCGAHGGVIDLVMQVRQCNFHDACLWLADDTNLVVSEPHKPSTINPQPNQFPPDTEYLTALVRRPILNDEARHFLFDVRKLNPKVIEWCRISSISEPTPCYRWGRPFYDAPSLLFPYRDLSGTKVLNVQSRYLGDVFGTPRFRFPSNSSTHIFNLPIVPYLKPGEPICASEGITDCLSMLSSHLRAVAFPSATTLKPEDMEVFRGHDIHVFPDNDDAGAKMYHRLLEIANELGLCIVKHDLPSDCKDYSDYYLKYLVPSRQPTLIA